MNWRSACVFSSLLSLALAASCSNDDGKAARKEPAAMGGEAANSGVSTGSTQGGTSGAAGSGGKAGAGSGGNKAGNGGDSVAASGGSNVMGSGGGDDDDEPRGGGASAGSAGDGSEPTGPVSACGAGNYDAGEPGCTVCPAPPPATDPPRRIGCDDFASAQRDGDGNLLLDLGALTVHETFGGDVSVDWVENGVSGGASVEWGYSFPLERFVFHLPLEARYADEILLRNWAFSDACGFSFSASSFRVYWDGVESWQCGIDP